MEKESFLGRITGTQNERRLGATGENTTPPTPQSTPKVRRPKEWLIDATEGQLSLDVYQTENDVVIKSTVAGISSDDIDITITNDMLTVKGSRSCDEEIRPEDYYYQECYWGPFSRSVILPADVEADLIKATLKNGILTIRLPKSEKIKTKKISINAE
ncbi:MAG: Hsp20/alpha crystallin family protein [Candidatus Azambacteria bacterium]|nr:Hsp20/alpha crystallin family protein [Candidatus Azambacteria bacterium]